MMNYFIRKRVKNCETVFVVSSVHGKGNWSLNCALKLNWGNMSGQSEECRKILVLYTGGTIGMVKNTRGVYIPSSNTFIDKIKSIPQMHDEYEAKKYFEGHPENEYLFIPHVNNNFTILYCIKEYDPLLDSSNMSVKDWIRIAKDIEEYYNFYDGFVILHGTDTMAYTASALSFMLKGLQKTVVVTGSQIPIFEPRSDAKDNFFTSLIFASCYNIPEVCVCFANKLLRGNRTVKVSSNLLEAFNSPNYNALGEVGINFRVYSNYVLKKQNTRFQLHENLNENVGILHLFPTISYAMLKAFLSSPIEGVVLESYGIGNIPSKRTDLICLLGEAVKRGVLIVNITQCAQGPVDTTYETGKALQELGIIPGYDMTGAAALSKLSYVLGLSNYSLEEKKKMMKTNIRGELTEN